MGDLSSQKLELLQLLLKRKGIDSRQTSTIPRRAESGPCELSYAQQRLWFLEQLRPGSSVYNLPAAVRLTGRLNTTALEQSLGEVRRRHASLRTVFSSVEGRAVQIVEMAGPLTAPIVDLRELSESEREMKLNGLAAEESHLPFDLTRGPVLRVTLLRLKQDEYVLLFTTPHIVSDGWSMGVLIREAVSLYESFSSGRPSTLGPLPIQYTDFAAWQRQWLSGEVLETQLAYWKKRLGGTLPILNLPGDRPRPPVQTFRGARHLVRLPGGLTEDLRALSRREKNTLFVVLLSAFAVLLSRYTGQDDIVLGTPIANRNLPEVEGLIGFLVNTLVFRQDLSNNPSFLQLARQVKEEAIAAHAHQDIPFEKIVEDLRPVRDSGQTPLFQVCFALQDTPPESVGLPGLRITPVELLRNDSKFDLSLEAAVTDGQLVAWLTYNVDLLDATTVQRMGLHYRNLLAEIVANSESNISDFSLLTESERHQLLVEWNDQQAVSPPDRFAHQLFEDRAAEAPDRLAVVSAEEHITYQALNRRANRLAHLLRSLGVGPEKTVAICAGRCVEMVVGILATLKAGGAFMLLDTEHPKERLAFTLSDARVSALLTRRSLTEGVTIPDCPVVDLDAWHDESGGRFQEDLVSDLSMANSAYAIYTSGSTGQPKGVRITHGGLSNLIDWHVRNFGVNPSDRAPHLAGLAFDAAVWELFPYLAAGASVHLVDDEVRVSPTDLIDWLALRSITIGWLPTALAESVLSIEWPGRHSLRVMLTGGDRLHRHSRESMPFRLENSYGPTEASVVATSGPVAALESDGKLPDIGRPILNTQVYLLDQRCNPVPIGVPGELVIGGQGLSPGYFNQPGMTAEKFIPDRFCARPGSRLYKAGDLARYGPDGSIEFLGRIDNQMKLHGFRIEPGEIESVLVRHPELKDAVVLARQDEPGGMRLVAYTVPRSKPGPPVESMRSFLQTKLPGYMVPSAFVMLDELPLTPNGKVDRRLLGPPGDDHAERETPYVAPRTDVERILAGIWSQVLRVGRVGVFDNFFSLGGDSILSIQIIAKANQAGLRLTPQQLFQHQSIDALARVAGMAPKMESEQSPVVGPVQLTPIQLWFFEQNYPDPHHFNQAVLVEAGQRLNPAFLKEALGHLMLHHDALRHRFVPGEAGWRQEGAKPGGQVPFNWIDLSTVADRELGKSIEDIAARLQTSLDLSEGPLLRMALMDLGRGRSSRLLIIIHHLVVDGLSWRILLEDLWTSYRQLEEGKAVRLPQKSTSFKHWASRLKEYSRSEGLAAERDYWLKLVERPAPCLPQDNPGGANSQASARVISISLDQGETFALLHDIPSAFHTQVNDVLLTALARSFWLWTGERSLLLDLEGHGREEIFEGIDLSRTVGWFTSIFPVRLELTDHSDLINALKSIKEQLRRIPNRGIGYGLLRHLGRSADRAAMRAALPRAEISFNYLGQFDQLLSDASAFGPARESSGPIRSPRQGRTHLIEVNAGVSEGRLQLQWTYSESVHRRSTIERLAESYVESIRSLITLCRASAAGGYTPSDFPLARLDQQTLDSLFERDEQIEDIYGLTPLQQGMLVRTLSAPAKGVYLNQVCCTLQGNLNTAALRQAWQTVIDRHTIWRTAFTWEGLSEPLQMVRKRVDLPWVECDWRNLTGREREERLEAFLKEQFEYDFDLLKAPLMRLVMIRMEEETFNLIWSFHHLVMDGWSSPLLLKEVFAFYNAFSKGRSIQLDRARPYRDYIGWLKKQDRLKAEAFWRQRLKGYTPFTLRINSPTGKPDAAGKGYSEQQLRLPGNVTGDLQPLARRHELTLNTIAQGMWALLLSHYSGQKDVVFGAVVSGRPADLTGADSIVGPFINTLPVRVKIEPERELLSWLKDLQSDQAEVRQYEYSSLVEVQAWSDAPRNRPLFDNILVFENYPVQGPLHLEDESLRIKNSRAAIRNHYPLTMRVSLQPRLTLEILYDCGCHERPAVAEVLSQFEALLLRMIREPRVTVRSLVDDLDESDRRKKASIEREFQETRRRKLMSLKRSGAGRGN